MQSIPSAPLPRGDPRRRPATTSLTEGELQEMIDDSRSTVEVKNHCQNELSRRAAAAAGAAAAHRQDAEDGADAHINKKQKAEQQK